MKLYLTVLFFAVFLIFSCSEKFNIEHPEQETLLVMNSLIKPDTNIRVFLSQIVPVLSDSSVYPKNAQIELRTNGKFSENLKEIAPGIFESEQNAQAGINYTLYAYVPGFDPLKASTTIPQAPEVTYVSCIEESIYVQQQMHYMDDVTVSFDDPQDKTNYYQISFYSHYSSEESQSDSVQNIAGIWYLDSTHPAIINEGDIQYYTSPEAINSLIFSDKLLSETNTIPFVVWLTGGLNYKNMILMRSITEDYYLYEKSRVRQFANLSILDYNPMNFFLVDNPNDLYSNVENGLGIVAGYSETHHEFDEYDFSSTLNH